MAAAWAEGSYREAHPWHKGRLRVRFPLRPPPGQCRDTPLGWSYQTHGNPERRIGDGERPVAHRKDGSRPAAGTCGTTIRDSGVWSPILLLKKESVSSILACPTSGIAAPAPRVTMEEYKEGRGRVNVILFLALGYLQRCDARPLTLGLPGFTPVRSAPKIQHSICIPWFTSGFE